MPRTYSREDVQTAAGLTYRQFRTRRQRGIIPPPEGSDTHPIYTDRHMRIARELRELESAPRTLRSIARELHPTRVIKRHTPSS